MRTEYCGEVTAKQNGEQVTLCGWVHRRRDHGGVIFIDLRDRQGLVQVVFHPEAAAIFEKAGLLRVEYVIKVQGTVQPRPEGTVNKDLATGAIEINALQLEILNTATDLPFHVDEYQEVGEEIRLRYRYLDLRRPEIYAHFKLRTKIVSFIRHYLDQKEFLDIETPILTKATPEGARDYLVPSRVHPGCFYALPQSPQIFKQLLMAAGMDRYYQIVRCFRDEDLRADRQPEFTQLDMEMSFIDENDIQQLTENLIRDLFKQVLSVDLPNPFPRITYSEAMQTYGTDRPDLRIPLKLIDVTDLMTDVDFNVFQKPALDPNGRVAVIKLNAGAKLSRKEIDAYTKHVSQHGAKGLAYIKVNDISKKIDGMQSPIVKFLGEEKLLTILERTQAEDGDILFFGADSKKIVGDALSALCSKLAADFNLYTEKWCPLWVTDFPMFEQDDTGAWQALHHPFTAPQQTDPKALLDNPGKSLSRAYDMVLNGLEIGGGSIRIHQLSTQLAAFEILGIDKEEATHKFQHLLQAIQMGCPPHGGIAFGIDRLVMLMAEVDSIRDVIAFPKTQSAACPLTQAPSPAGEAQLKELHIRTRQKVSASNEGK